MPDTMQAQDRAYRIGQRRHVDVFRMVSIGTMEETIYLRQVYKEQQAAMTTEGTSERAFFYGQCIYISLLPVKHRAATWCYNGGCAWCSKLFTTECVFHCAGSMAPVP